MTLRHSTPRVREAVLSRIAEMGDMPVTVSRHTLSGLLFDLGFAPHAALIFEGDETHHEVPAPVLEALVLLAGRAA